MNIPGFTADVSLYKTSGHYRLAVGMAGMTTMHIGLAQFMRPLPDGLAGGPHCKPRCVPCQPDSTSETGCSRCCLDSVCEWNCEPCTAPSCKPTPTCGPCVGFRQCSDGSQKSCSV